MSGWRCKKGFTLIEIMMTLAISAVLLMVAIPAWTDYIKKKQLITVMEGLYDTLKLAHSESIRQKKDITVAFTQPSATSWCYALSDNGSCDCSAGACSMEGVSHVINGENDVGLEISNLTNNKYVTFEGTRGLASDAGVITLTKVPYKITLSINKLGLLKTCSNTVVGYSVCF